MIKRISLSELPEKALDETLQKYSRALWCGTLQWVFCRICKEIDACEDRVLEECDVDGCEDLCPLYPSGWRRNAPDKSKLYKYYPPFETEKDTVWEQNVNNYLWWVTIELELRRAGYEKHLGGA